MRVRVRVPGDKSITQRALICAALAEGTSRLRGLLAGDDALSTASALRALGARVGPIPTDGSEIRIEGVGLRGLRSPRDALDLGNSGTGARLILGLLAGSGLEATVTGDASLRSRPMRRVIDPLSRLGASFKALGVEDRLPLALVGARPARCLQWVSPVASAQVKSAALLAGLLGGVTVTITEPRRSRDHTERMFRLMGARVVDSQSDNGWRVELPTPPDALEPLDLTVPRDPSSAAFAVALAVSGGAGRAEIQLPGVGLNPGRTAFFAVLARMGARVTVEPTTGSAEERVRGSAAVLTSDREPRGTIRARLSRLEATTVHPIEVPNLIDELPLVAVLGAIARGETSIRGAQELRAKESDRISALVSNLRSLGAEVEERVDGLSVLGSGGPLRGRVRSFGDHRIAMAFAVLGAVPGNCIEIDTPDVAKVSYPGFWDMLAEAKVARASA